MDVIAQNALVQFFFAWEMSWFLVSCIRLHRYARIFQQFSYDERPYFAWFVRNMAEQRYQFLSCAFLAVAFITVIVFVILCTVDYGNIGSIILGIACVTPPFSALYLAPRDCKIKYPLMLTRRAIRLLMTAYIVTAVPPIIGVFAIWYFFARLVESGDEVPVGCIIGIVFGLPTLVIATAAGPISHLITPYVLPFVNALNYPVDAAISKLKYRKPSA